VIDWSRIAELHDEVGADALGDVLELFAQEVAEGLERLQAAPTPKARAAEFHFLKGAALNLGLDTIAETCARGEEKAAQGAATDSECASVVAEFPACCATLVDGWRAGLGLA